MDLVIQKYGGAAVSSLERIERVADHIVATVSAGKRVVVTISAMGEHTNELIAMARGISPEPPKRELDMLMTAGERVSMALLSIALHKRGSQAISLTGSQCGILTDETHGNARITKILGDRIRAGIDENRVVIVAGFQGVSPKTKEVTTLGRGGTDLSAIALAACLGAQSCELYKDVEGLRTTDPRLVPEARAIKQIDYRTMTEMAWAGSTVLHPRGAHVAAQYNVPFSIKSVFKPDAVGTLVTQLPEEESMEKFVVKALTHQSDICVANVSRQEFSPAIKWLWSQGESPLFSRLNHDVGSLVVSEKLCPEFEKQFQIKNVERGMSSVTIVGAGFKQNPEVIDEIFSGVSPDYFEFDNHSIHLCISSELMKETLEFLHSKLM